MIAARIADGLKPMRMRKNKRMSMESQKARERFRLKVIKKLNNNRVIIEMWRPEMAIIWEMPA